MAQPGGIGSLSQLGSQPGAAQALSQLSQGPNGLGQLATTAALAALAAREGKVDLAAARGSLAKAGRASLDKAEAAKALAARVLAGKANSGAKGKASVARVPSGKLNWVSAKGLSARASRVLAAKECSNFGGQQVPFGGNGLQLPFGQANNPLLGNSQPNQTTPSSIPRECLWIEPIKRSAGERTATDV